MRRRQRQTLHYRNWYRSLYVGMRSDERFLAHQQRWLAEYRVTLKPATVAGAVRLQISLMRGIDQSWRFLQPEARR